MSRQLRALVVDDERLARRWLCGLLREYPQIRVEGEANGVKSAIELLGREALDVIFLDIQMPPENGFDLLRHLPPQTQVVFVTAYDTFAVKAFEANALDYLLKPVHPGRLAETVSRLLAVPSGETAQDDEPSAGAQLQLEDYVSVSDRGLLRIVPVSQIAAIRADASYTHVFLTGEASLFVFQSISDWNEQLPTPPFIRLDRSTLMNLSLVRTVKVISRDETQVMFEGVGDPLVLGRSASQRLRKELKRQTQG